MLSSSINQKNCDTFSFSSFIFSFRGVRGKVASLGRVCNSCDFSAVELVMCNEAKNFSILRTTYSRMDKLSPDDATLHPVSCRTPPFLPFSQIKRYDVRLVAPTFKTYVHLRWSTVPVAILEIETFLILSCRTTAQFNSLVWAQVYSDRLLVASKKWSFNGMLLFMQVKSHV